MDSTDKTKRSVILYILVAIALSAALVSGIWWAKNRADYYAQQSEQAGQPQVQPTPEEIASQAQEQSSGNTEVTPNPVVAPSEPPLPASVPAAGMEQGLLPIGSLCAFIFAWSSYIKARRKLMAYKTFTL